MNNDYIDLPQVAEAKLQFPKKCETITGVMIAVLNQ